MGLLDDAIREHLELKRRRGADAGEVSREEGEALGPVRRTPDGTPDLSSIPGLPTPAQTSTPADARSGYDVGPDHEDETGIHVRSPAAQPRAGESPRGGYAPPDGEPPRGGSKPPDGEPPPFSYQPPPVAPPPVVYNEPAPPRTWEPLLPPSAAAPPPAIPAETPREDVPPPAIPAETPREDVPPPAPLDEPPAEAPREKSLFRGGPSRLRLRRRGDEAQSPPFAPPPPDDDDDPFIPAQQPAPPARSDYEPPLQPSPAHNDDVVPAEEGEDLLEETPEFLEETPDHDRLWFEQRPPRDFDFDG